MKYFTSVSSTFDIYTHFIFWALLACFARDGLTLLTDYSNSYINPNGGLGGSCLWSNFTACLIFSFWSNSVNPWGYLIEDYYKLAHVDKNNLELELTKKHFSLFIGLSTAFCGGFSTFSSLIVEVFIKTADFINTDGRHLPNHGYGVMEFFSVLLVQLGISLLGIKLGKDMNTMVHHKVEHFKRHFTFKRLHIVTQSLSIIGVCFFIVVIVLSFVLHESNNFKYYAMSLAFSPFGGWLRYYLSRFNLNKIIPLGTLMANLLGCTVISITMLLIHGNDKSGSGKLITNEAQILVLRAIQSGFCGSLTTTSTFVMELYTMDSVKKHKHVYSYLLLTIIPSFLIALLIIGSYGWAVGLSA